MRVVAATGAWASATDTAAADIADISSDASTRVVPLDRAAVVVDDADILAALLVAAIRIVVRVAAALRLGRAASGLRARAGVTIACWIDLRFHSAELVPRNFAANGIEEAHRVATCFVTTRRRILRLAARACALVAAIEITLGARGLRA